MKAVIHLIYNQLLDKLVKGIGILLVCMILIQIGGRYLLTSPLGWTEEFSRFLFIWFAFLGSVLTLINHMHLGIEFFYQKFQGMSRKVLDIVIQAAVLCFGVVILIYGLDLVELGFYQKSPIMRWPLAYFYLAVPVTGALFALWALKMLVELIRPSNRLPEAEQ